MEAGRAWRPDGTEVRKYSCGCGRIAVSVWGERVELRRKFGVVCPGLDIALADLVPLVAFLRWWKRHRSRWAAFYWLAPGTRPAGAARRRTTSPPGAVPEVRVATKGMGKLQGEDFTGRNVRVHVDPAERVAGVADLQARVVRRGERLGDPAGEDVGGVYRCGKLRIEADSPLAPCETRA